MTDLSYTEAVEAARGAVALGPVECSTCRAWVEYAGGAWVGVGSDQLHECAPFMAGVATAEELAEGMRATSEPVLTTLGALSRGAGPALARYQQAHELPEPEPEWVAATWRPVAVIATLFVAALAVAALARWANI
jgi:hypothetical protein